MVDVEKQAVHRFQTKDQRDRFLRIARESQTILRSPQRRRAITSRMTKAILHFHDLKNECHAATELTYNQHP
jgi:hypothetical protein